MSYSYTTNQDGASSNQPELYQRRESLVKPTWHNVCPGQVPADTLEKLKKMGNGGHDNYLVTGNNNNQALIGVGGVGPQQQQRPEDTFDLFGKVFQNTLTFLFFLIEFFK